MAVKPPQTKNDLFLRAARGEPHERTPVWAMRQAGRWDPEFLRLRGSKTFYEFSENSETAAAASLCPRRFGVDAIILFYDITTLAVSMGQKFTLVPDRGPVPERPIRTLADVKRLTVEPAETEFRSVLETLRIVRRELNDELPALVFAGAPFTLGAYQIGAGKELTAVRRFASEQPHAWSALLDRTAAATIVFLKSLLDAGATAFQLFDSWAGGLTRAEYLQWAQPYHRRILDALDACSILFVKDCPYPDLLAASGARVISLGKNDDVGLFQRTYSHLAVQGNVDHELLIDGSTAEVREATRHCLAAGALGRHILNLDHGMDRLARVENFEAFIDSAKIHGRRG